MRALAALLGVLMIFGTGTAATAAPGGCLTECVASAHNSGGESVGVLLEQRSAERALLKRLDGHYDEVPDTRPGARGRSTCPGCTYTRVPLVGPGAPNGGFAGPFAGCPGGQIDQTQLVFRTTPGNPARELVGTICPGAPAQGGPAAPVITIGMIEGEVRRFAEQVTPPSTELGFAPAGTAIVNLPVLVWATPESTIQRDFAPFGIPVSVTLVPSWEWTFEPGATTRTATPGQPYRDNGIPVADDPAYVRHAYRAPGQRQIGVTVRWSASWSLDGGAPRPLGDLTRTDTASVLVREAPSRLVAR